MNKQRTTPRRWRELGITAKFASAFGMLLALMALVSLTSYLALTAVRRQTEAAIVTSMETQRLVLEMDAGLQRARRLERDLFLRWPAVGFSQALETYSRQHDEEIAQVMARSASLQGLISGSDVSDALRESEVSLNFYLSAADRYAATFDEAIELVTELATDETGAQARLERNSELLRDMLQLADDPTLMVLYREMQSFEKEYLVTRQRPYMQSAFNVAGPLREAISASSGFDEAEQAQVLVFLDDYQAVAEEILLLDVEIGHKLNEFDLQAEAIDPISEELIGLANAETQRAREQITRTSRLATTLLAVAILAAVALVIVIALALNNSITRNVVKLTKTASELRGGNLEIRAHIESADELGQLADSFNAMANRIKTLVDTLEQKVEERTADLTKANVQLQQEINERMRAEKERERLLLAERAQARRQAALFRLSAELAATLDETEVCRCVVDGLHDTLGYDQVDLFVVDEATSERVPAASAGAPDAAPVRIIPPGQGLSERPLLDGQLHYTPDVSQDPRYVPGLDGSEVDVPIQIGETLLGVLVVESQQPNAFSQDDFDLLTAAAQQAGLAVGKARLLAAERQRADELDALRTTMADVTAELEVSALLRAIVERAAGLLDATGGELGLYDEASQEIKVVVSHNLGENYVGTRHKLGEGAMGRVAETGEPLIIENYQTWEGRAPQYSEIHLRAGLSAPLGVGGRLVGVISISDTSPTRQFTPADLHLLNLFAHQAAIAIENARLYADLRASQEYARNIIDSSLDPIIAVDKERRVVEFNTAAQDTFGYRSEEILGQNVDVLYADRQEGSDIHWKTIEEGRCIREVMNKRKNGEVFPAFLSSSLLHDARGELVGVMGVSRDITERVRAEAELRKHQEHLEELVEERTSELRASEERYRTLFDGVPVGLYRTTPAGQIVDANLALVQMMGYPTREDYLVANPVSFYVDPGERVRWQALMEREGVVRDFEIQMYKYDGALFWVNNSARAVRDEGGRVLCYEGSLEDITERKQAEAELGKYREHLEELVEERTAKLRESEERYRTLFDGVPVGLYRTTPDGPIVDVNLAMVHMLGYPSREEFLALESTASLYVNPEERVQAGTVLDQDGVVRDFETRMYKHDGSVIWVSQTARAVRDKQGQVLYHEGSLEDITRRKEFEGEIRRQKDYFEALFVNSPTAVVTADLDGNVVSWNPMAEKLFWYSQEQAIGKNLDDLVANDPRVREEAVHYSHQAITKGRVQATTKRTRKDGSLVDVEVLALPVIVAGEKVGFIAIYHDISELQEARRAAEAANQAKSAFLASMSHELRTPLNAILGFAQLMDRDPNLTVEQQENMTIINRSGEHLLALINDVLEMSKIEAGRVTLEEKSFDLYRMLDGLEEMFRLRAEDKGLALSFERAENVPRYVRTDEGKLRQVLSNLLGNAVKFTQEGGVTLRARSKEGSSVSLLPASYTLLQFEVEDTGPGLAPEELAVVFDPFVQATSEQRSQEGTGLGLSISRQFVRLMGGDLSVSSEMGRGSLFKFDVQAGLVEAAEAQEAQRRRRVLGLAPDQPVYRLLVAEDKDTNRRLLVKLLESLGPSTGSGPGFEVREAINGQETIEMWEHWEPHLIWMDMRMPVVDGYQATKHIKTEMKNRKSGIQTVIVALTASAFEEDREKVLSQGCDDFVRKPFREDEIYEVLNKHLGVRFVYEEGATQKTRVQPREAAAPLGAILTPDALTALPPDWVADLQKATIKADLSLILVLIDQISEENQALAQALGDLAHDYQYKRILTLIEQAGGQR